MQKYTDNLRFGTVSAPQTTPGSGTTAAIAHTKELGLHHFEIAWTHSVRVTDETCAEIKATAEKYGISLSIHAPYFINLNSQTDELMGKSDERLLLAARKGYLAGAKDIVFHPGSFHSQPREGVLEKSRAKLKEIMQKLHDEGVEVNIRPEAMGKAAMIGSLEDTLELCRDIPGVLPCIDWAHLHARTGNGTFNSYEEFDAALKLMRETLGDDVLKNLHSHMSGIDYGPKGEKSHIPLNESDFRYRELLQAFVDHDVHGTVGIEAPMPFHTSDCLTFQATYRRLVEIKEGKELEQPED